MAMYQFVAHCENPKLSHDKVIKCITKHLLGMRCIRIQVNINASLELIAFVD